jgi:glycosyltransferase involved in cell wall biosynthesis
MKIAYKLVFSVTNDLSYDQRMIRICSSLAAAGYDVTLVGRRLLESIPPEATQFRQKRLFCIFRKGFLFYAEFNMRLFFFLLFLRADLVCAVDLDTILPNLLVSRLKRLRHVYDAHELFCEMKEVVKRPRIYTFWKMIERWTVPSFRHGYTVNSFIASELRKEYNVNYVVIRNLPRCIEMSNINPIKGFPERYIIYQGAVNEGRCFETVIPAMKNINAKLVICGDGNFMQQAKKIASQHSLNGKVTFTGWLPPDQLAKYTAGAVAGLNIIENTGLSNRYSLSNRFFDYINAALPQVCVNYAAYAEINDKYHCALLINDTSAESIANAVNKLLSDQKLYDQLRANCMVARKELNWQNEEQKLIAFYLNIFASA